MSLKVFNEESLWSTEKESASRCSFCFNKQYIELTRNAECVVRDIKYYC